VAHVGCCVLLFLAGCVCTYLWYGTLALGSILPWRVRFGLLDATISILAFLFEPAQGLFLGAIHYQFWGYTVALKQQREQIVSITLQFH
jgi:hypothetical protein